MELPILYGKTSSGKIKEWQVSYSVKGEVTAVYGLQGGKMQTRTDPVEIKNVGKANETTLFEQAESEAKSKWAKQIKKDYAESVETIPESTLPNLAHKYQEKAHMVVWPCHILTKFDGLYGMIFYKHGDMFFQSRGGEAYPIIQEIADEVDDNDR